MTSSTTLSPRPERIDAFVNAFWLVPYAYDQAHALAPQVQAHWKSLEDKFGLEVMQRFYMKSNMCKLSDYNQYMLQELTDFTYAHGLQYDISPDIALRGKETLRMLIDHFTETRPSPFSLFDMGAGDGRLAAGLAITIPQVRQAMLFDLSSEAQRQYQTLVDKQSPADAALLKEKVTFCAIDYKSEMANRYISLTGAHGTNVMLFAYPYQTFKDAPTLGIMKNFLNLQKENTVVYISDHVVPDDASEFQQHFDLRVRGCNRRIWAEENKMTYRVIAEKRVTPTMTIQLQELKNAE